MMPEKQYPQRKSPRLQGYDYAQSGAYFVTICTQNRACLFGDVVNGAMVLSRVGEIAHQEIRRIPEYWPGLADIDGAVVMPNHVHMIVVLVGTAFLPSGNRPPGSQMDTQKRVPTLGDVVGNYKAGVTRLARRYTDHDDPIWQARFHDHIIRNDRTLTRIREYILYNPARWQDDRFYSPK